MGGRLHGRWRRLRRAEANLQGFPRHGNLCRDNLEPKQGACGLPTRNLVWSQKVPYTFTIWSPYADKVTHQCLAAYKKGTPFACLVPGELVSYIAQEKDGTYNEQVARMVEDSGKISFLDSGLVWLIHGAKPVRRVLTAERLTIEPAPDTFVGVV